MDTENTPLSAWMDAVRGSPAGTWEQLPDLDLYMDQVVRLIQSCPFGDKLTILEQDAGLHFLVQVDTSLSDEQLVERCRQKGLLVQSLGSFYHGPVPTQHQKCLVINYSGLKDDDLDRLHTIITGGFL